MGDADSSRPPNWRTKIELIVPCHNHGEYLPEAFASIAEQTWTEPVTLTFVDDNSSDQTPEVIGSIARSNRGPRFTVRALTNRRTHRQWASINQAIGRSSNELFVIVNDDDLLVPDCLEKIVATYEAHPDIHLLGAQSIWFKGSGPPPAHEAKPIDQLELRIFTPAEALAYRALNDLPMTHSSCSFFRLAWRAVRGYYPKRKRIHPRANEDRDFQMRVSALFSVGVYVDYPFAYWRTDSSHGQSF